MHKIKEQKEKSPFKEPQAKGLRIEEIHEEKSNEESQGESNKDAQNERSSEDSGSEKSDEEKEDPFKESSVQQVQAQEKHQVQEREKSDDNESLSTLMQRRKLDALGSTPYGIRTNKNLSLILNVQRNQTKSPSVNLFAQLSSSRKNDSESLFGDKKSPSTLLGSPLKDKIQNSPEKKKLDHTRKLLKFITESDSKASSITSPPATKLDKVPLDYQETSLDTEVESEKILKTFPIFKGSLDDASSPESSNRPFASTNSSLLQRRMSHKPSLEVQPSLSSTHSSPSIRSVRSNFSNRINSIEVTKSPESMAKKEAKFNQSYRTFLANRPQNWEENAVSTILSAINAETSVRIVLQNLSLASSFLKIRQKKKSNLALIGKLYSDTNPAYLFFNEKMVKKGETKYKVSPPFRNKENRRLLVENLRLGGIDTMSSYHFFVPSRFKEMDEGNFRRAFGGLNSMGCSLQAVWTALYSYQKKNNKKFLEDPAYMQKTINLLLRQMYKTMCLTPAQMLKISHKKGTISKGRDADFVIWDPYRLENNTRLNKSHVFEGRAMLGTVYKTYVRGNLIYDKEGRDQIDIGYKPEFITPN
jgi:hypothetical protein